MPTSTLRYTRYVWVLTGDLAVEEERAQGPQLDEPGGPGPTAQQGDGHAQAPAQVVQAVLEERNHLESPTRAHPLPRKSVAEAQQSKPTMPPTSYISGSSASTASWRTM